MTQSDIVPQQTEENIVPDPPTLSWVVQVIPGVLLTAIVAWLGIESSEWIGTTLLGFERSPVSGVMMAIVFGLILSNVMVLPQFTKPGVQFSLKRLLKLGIILLGIRLSLGDVFEVGLVGIPLIILCILGALFVAQWLSGRLVLSPRLSALLPVATSICGATAIVATGPAIDAKEEEITYAIANITVFGIVAMFLYPYLAHLLFPDNALGAGLMLGTSIHETAQVAGSGLIYVQLFGTEQVLDVATVTKLVRNVMMAVIIPAVVYFSRRGTDKDGDSREGMRFLDLFPVFILGFLFVALLRTIGDATFGQSGQAFGFMSAATWDNVTHTIRDWAEILLAVAMAGVGLGTSFRQLRNLGIKPFYVGFASAVSVVLISISGLMMMQWLSIL